MNKSSTRIVFAFILCCCLYFSLSQNQGTSHQSLLNEYRKAETWYNKATAAGTAAVYNEQEENRLNRLALEAFKKLLPGFDQVFPQFDSLQFYTSFRIGELEHFFEAFQDALHAYNLSITIHKHSHLPDSLLFKPYLYAGIIYYNQNKYDSASQYLKKAETVQTGYNYSLEENERLFNMLGVLLYEKGDYKQAANYFRKALEVLPTSHPYYNGLFTNFKINLGQIHMKLEEFDQANQIYQELLKHSSNTGLLNEIFHSIGSIHLRLGAPQKALEYFDKVNYSGNKTISLFNSRGQAFLQQHQYEAARQCFDSALHWHQQLGSNSDPLAYGQTHKLLGDLSMETKAPLKALDHYQQAMQRFYPGFTNASVQENPENFSGLFSYINLFNTLVAKAEAFHLLYEQGQNLSWAQHELRTYQSAFELIDYVQRSYNSDESRLFIDQTKYVVHSRPIDIAYEVYQKTKDINYLEALYVFDQQNKATILAMHQYSGGRPLSREDSSLLEKEKQTRSEISLLGLKATQVIDSTELSGYHLRIRDLEIDLGEIRSKLQLAETTLIPSTGSVRNLLEKNTQLISYHLSATHLTTILLSKNQFEVFQDTLPGDFHESITRYINEVRSAGSGTNVLAKIFYELLFRHSDPGKFERLILIPDDELHFISFESLMDEKNGYLLQKSAVQYQYSTTLLKKERSELAEHQTLSLAPFAGNGYRDSSNVFVRLMHSLKEVRETKGRHLIDSQATKTNFITALKDFPVIHLATHAVVNSSSSNLSFIAFSPGNTKDFLLYAEEIQHLPLRGTRLVILSACETGSGNLIRGEGIISLSRAFYYAGCENIITTLWKANDFSTAYISTRFHQYLDQSFTIDVALQKAKLDYLDDPAINPRLKHPHYWSHLVFIGNHSVVKKQKTAWVLIIGGCLVLLAAILVINKARRPGKVHNR
ncbi:MAG: CHAT domain-containing protein [Flavisolibacter sp.]